MESCAEGTAYYACHECRMACDTVALDKGKEDKHGVIQSGVGICSEK